MSNRIKGILSPVVTPFKKDLTPDTGRFVAHCKWLLSQNCGLAAFGTNSEANSMSLDERMALLDAAIAMAPYRSCARPQTINSAKNGCWGGVFQRPVFWSRRCSIGCGSVRSSSDRSSSRPC